MLLKHLSGDGKFVAPTSAEVTKHRKSGLAITRCISQERVWPEQRSGCQCSQRSNCLSPGNQVSLLCFHSPYVRSEIETKKTNLITRRQAVASLATLATG